MTGIRAAKKRETRQAILQAAVRLFAERGYDGTSIEDLARAAGIGKATVYGYFREKREIFLAFCEEEIDYALAEVAGLSSPAAPLAEQLLTLFLSQVRFVTGNREFGRHLIREMTFPRAATSGPSRELDARYLDAVGEILEGARQRRELRNDFDPFLATAHFYGLYLVVLSGWYAGYVTTMEEAESSLRTLFRQALEGLGSRPASDLAATAPPAG
jgi:AcrR family transcriptional regulator